MVVGQFPEFVVGAILDRMRHEHVGRIGAERSRLNGRSVDVMVDTGATIVAMTYEDAERAHHDHLIDIESGKVVEFRNEQIEALQRTVAEQLGYRIVDHRLEIYAVPIKRAEGKAN